MMNIKFKSLIAILLLGCASSVSGQQMPQAKPAWMTGSGISGPGLPVTGDGAGGWRSGSAGVAYKRCESATGMADRMERLHNWLGGQTRRRAADQNWVVEDFNNFVLAE